MGIKIATAILDSSLEKNDKLMLLTILSFGLPTHIRLRRLSERSSFSMRWTHQTIKRLVAIGVIELGSVNELGINLFKSINIAALQTTEPRPKKQTKKLKEKADKRSIDALPPELSAHRTTENCAAVECIPPVNSVHTPHALSADPSRIIYVNNNLEKEHLLSQMGKTTDADASQNQNKVDKKTKGKNRKDDVLNKNTQLFVKRYAELLKLAFGDKWTIPVDKATVGKIRNYLRDKSLDRCLELLEIYFAIKEPYFEKRAYDFSTFLASQNRLHLAHQSGFDHCKGPIKQDPNAKTRQNLETGMRWLHGE